MPWWLVVTLAAVLSSFLVTTIQSLTYRVEEEAMAACLADPPVAPSPAVEPCPLRIFEYAYLPWYMRWVGGVFVLVLLLPIYGFFQVVRKRRRGHAA
jgi:hypothetical protein